MLPYYGSINDANGYFAQRLHSQHWTVASAATQTKALVAASQIIDTLAFKGRKHAVWMVLSQYTFERFKPQNIDELIRQAELQQAQEFPRDADTVVPIEICIACYEIAYALLSGRDPEKELETLPVVHQGYGPVRITYDRTNSPLEHLMNGVPSYTAWRLLRGYLRDEYSVRLARVS